MASHVLSRARIRLLWSSLLSTLWFVPGLLVLAGAGLAVLMVDLSARIDAEVLTRWPRIFGASADSSRDMLAAIAGSLITVAGVTFSLTMVAVTQASAQYSPRILRNFMRDRASQIVLGGLAGIFTYCLVVLRTIRGPGEEDGFVPSVAVLVGFIFAVLGIALLIFFIHHIASALQASSIISRVADDTVHAIDRLFPADVGEPDGRRDDRGEEERLGRMRWLAIPAHRAGYIQNVDGDTLLEVARRYETVVRMDCAVGDFLIPGLPVASVAMAPGVPEPPSVGSAESGDEATSAWRELADELAGAFDLGTHRTVEQDASFGVRQIVDIAQKALSPGINDPTTAMNAVDHLGVVLARAGVRSDEPSLRYDESTLRIVARGPTFETLAERGLSEIRRYAESHVAVLTRLVDVVEALSRLPIRESRRTVLERHLDLLEEASRRSVKAPHDRDMLVARIASARQTLARAPAAWASQQQAPLRAG